MTWRGLPVGLYVALVFLSGALVGVLGHRLYVVRSGEYVPAWRSSPDAFRRHYLHELRNRVGLSGDQESRINAILEAGRARFEEIHKRIEPEMKALKQEQVRKIREALSAVQQPVFDAWRASRQHGATHGK